MSIRSYRDTFTAAAKKQYRGGSFFNIAALTDEVTIRLFSHMGNSIAELENIGAGFWIKLDVGDGIGYVEVESATAQTVDVIIGDGEFGANKTSTTITGGVLGAQTLVSNYRNAAVPVAAQTIVTPAANVNGVRIDSIMSSLGVGIFQVVSKTSAPSAYDDGAARVLYSHYHTTSTINTQFEARQILPCVIPAGEGLYTIGSFAGASLSLDYEVL